MLPPDYLAGMAWPFKEPVFWASLKFQAVEAAYPAKGRDKNKHLLSDFCTMATEKGRFFSLKSFK